MRICTLILIGVVLYLISAEGTVWETFNSGGTGHDLFLWTVRGSVPAKAPAANLLDLEATEVIQLVIILDYTDCEPHLTSILVIRFVLMTTMHWLAIGKSGCRHGFNFHANVRIC